MTIQIALFLLFLLGFSSQQQIPEEYFEAYGDYFNGLDAEAPLAVRSQTPPNTLQKDNQPPTIYQPKKKHQNSTQNDITPSSLPWMKDVGNPEGVNATTQVSSSQINSTQEGEALNDQSTALNETSTDVSNEANVNTTSTDVSNAANIKMTSTDVSNVTNVNSTSPNISNATNVNSTEGVNSRIQESTDLNNTTQVNSTSNEYLNQEQPPTADKSINVTQAQNASNDIVSEGVDQNSNSTNEVSQEKIQNATSLQPLSDQLVTGNNDSSSDYEANVAFTNLEEAISEAVNQTDDSSIALQDLTHTDKAPADGVAEMAVKDIANGTVAANTTKYVHTGFNDDGDAENSVGTQLSNTTYNNGTNDINSVSDTENIGILTNKTSMSNDSTSQPVVVSAPAKEFTNVEFALNSTSSSIESEYLNQTSSLQINQNQTEQDILKEYKEDIQNASSISSPREFASEQNEQESSRSEDSDQESPIQQLDEGPQKLSQYSQQSQSQQYNQNTEQKEYDENQMLAEHPDEVQQAEKEQENNYFANLEKNEQNVSSQDSAALDGLSSNQLSQLESPNSYQPASSDEVSRPDVPLDGLSIPSAIQEKQRQYEQVDFQPQQLQQEFTTNTQILDENQIQDIRDSSDFSSTLLMGAVGLFIFVALLYYISKWMRSSASRTQYSSLTTYSGEGGLGGGSMKLANSGSSWDKGWDEGWGKDDEGQNISKRRGKAKRGEDFI